MATRMVSKVYGGQVYTNCSDIIRSLYEDLNCNSDEKVKQYIKDSIELWKDYEEQILEKVSK